MKYYIILLLAILLSFSTFSIDLSIADNSSNPAIKKSFSIESKDSTQGSKSASSDSNSSNQDKILYTHDCDTNANRKTPTGLAGGGVLRYDIDCAPFYNDQILYLIGRSSWSIVGWFQRLLGSVQMGICYQYASTGHS